MATKKRKKVSKLEKAKTIIKKINNDLIDASFDAIETTVKTGEKWQKLTAKLIKKTEPLTKQQINMFTETAETIKGQLENGTERLKKLVGFNSAVFEQAKDIVTENPLAKKAERMTAKLKKEITETIEEISEEVQEKVGKKAKRKTKKTTAKKTPAKKATAKKPATKKTVVKKETAKKAVVKENTGKDDLKVIKGIGPKIETILNNAGITSYKELAKLSVTSINKILSEAEIVNIKIYNTSDWKVLAKEAVERKK